MAARDSMAKSLYSALFDWIILHINHAMLNRRDMEESVSVSDIELSMLYFAGRKTQQVHIPDHTLNLIYNRKGALLYIRRDI